MTNIDKHSLASMIEMDDDTRKLASLTMNWQTYNCRYLQEKIRKILEILCDRDLSDPCEGETKSLLSLLCKLWTYFKKYCCKCHPSCLPYPPVWYDLVDTMLTQKKVTTVANTQYIGKLDLTVKVNVGDLGGLDGSDFDIDVILPIPCDTLKIELSRTFKIICEYREKSLCGKNKLTESLNHFCEIYPRFVEYCCN